MRPLLVVLASLGLCTAFACEKQENETRAAERRYEDTLNLADILETPGDSQSLASFDAWLALYPQNALQTNLREGTSPIGQVAQAYFSADPGQRPAFHPYFQKLLSLGADPNVNFPFEGQNRGLAELALELSAQDLIDFIIAENGLANPPAQLACAAQLAPPPAGRIPLALDTPQFVADPQTQFDIALRSYIDELLSIEAKPDNRLTVGSIEAKVGSWTADPAFVGAFDFNRIIVSCKTGESLNLLGAAARTFLAEPMRVPLQWTGRNRTLTAWFETRGARVCDALNVRDGSGTLTTETTKDLLRTALTQQNQAASASLKNANRTLWCDQIAPRAQAEGCWDPAIDITTDFPCGQ